MATGNKDYGWWGGASPSPGKSTVDRIDYANDTAAASTRGPLNTGRYRHGATGNTTQGYFIAGQPGTISSIERLDYSNDTVKPTFAAPIISNTPTSMTGAFSSQADALPQTFSQGYVGSYGAGYFGGGSNPQLSTVERIDYSNDTATASVRGPLSAARWYIMATSSSSHGYWMGGKNPSPAEVSTVDRVDYANDTATASARGPLDTAGYRGMNGVSNVNFGYTAGGGFPSTCSTMRRIDFGNDTATGVTKGPLTAINYLLSAAGNTSYGYFAGGSPPTAHTRVDRLDYGNDTATC